MVLSSRATATYSDAASEAHGEGDVTPAPGSDPVVLLVEDDAGVRNALRRLLEHESVPAAEAASLAEAHRAIEEHAASLRVMVVDLGLGEESGLELAEELHRRHSGLRVIVFSAQGDGVPDRRFRECGIEAVLAKPASPAAIVATVRRALGGEAPRMAGECGWTHPSRGEHRAS